VTSRRERFERLYREHATDVAAYALRRTDRATAEDVVAETFVVVWRRLHRVPAEPLPWLYAVARKVLANQRRGAARRSALRRRLESGTADASYSPDVVVRDALAALPESDREILRLVAWEGLSPTDAAVVLGCSATAARLRLYRARNRLADALGLSRKREVPATVEEAPC
jgi:RNA polymerase sigma-70 factor (ECF subfamily)